MRGIVYTRHDGGVSVRWPTRWALRALASSGFWDRYPEDFFENQVESGIAQGRSERAIRRYIRAMRDGGCTTAEAYEIIRDRDCAHLGTGHELWRFDELPDRWFRDAWRRSHNGGPISIDLKTARRIQFQRIRDAVQHEATRRAADIDLFERPVEIPLGALRDRIHQAESADELRRVWPQELASQAPSTEARAKQAAR
jgi:hypothetical protein